MLRCLISKKCMDPGTPFLGSPDPKGVGTGMKVWLCNLQVGRYICAKLQFYGSNTVAADTRHTCLVSPDLDVAAGLYAAEGFAVGLDLTGGLYFTAGVENAPGKVGYP